MKNEQKDIRQAEECIVTMEKEYDYPCRPSRVTAAARVQTDHHRTYPNASPDFPRVYHPIFNGRTVRINRGQQTIMHGQP